MRVHGNRQTTLFAVCLCFLGLMRPPACSAQMDLTCNWVLEEITYPYANGIAVDGANVFNGCGVTVNVYNKLGVFLYGFGTQRNDEMGFRNISDLAIDETNVYIADQGNVGFNPGIRVWSKTGTRLWGISSQGPGSTQFQTPSGIGLSPDNIYVADSGNNRIKVTTVRLKTPVNRALPANREFRRLVDSPKTLEKGGLSRKA